MINLIMLLALKDRTPWINNSRFDQLTIIFPGVIAVIFISIYLFFYRDSNSLRVDPVWIAFILLIDAAHFWSTIFRTYIHRSAFAKNRKMLITVPIVTYIICVGVYKINISLFWKVFGYYALWHLMKQQEGLLRIYLRKEIKNISYYFDLWAIRLFVILPILYWHFIPRNFFWFQEDVLVLYNSPFLGGVCLVLLFVIFLIFLMKEFCLLLKNKVYNSGKILLIISTFLTWYFGIIFFDNDISFTTTNIIAHGVPYISLIWFTSVRGGPKVGGKVIPKTINKNLVYKLTFYLFVIFFLAGSEEILWDIVYWKKDKNILGFGLPSLDFNEGLLSWIVPALAIPKMVHYTLDRYVWHTKYSV